jgi:intein/homing endonuclease
MNNKKTIPLDYANGLIYELEKAFWDERGRGARFRMTTVGREYYQDRVRSLLQSSELEHILKTIQDVLEKDGITGRVSYDRDGRLLRVSVNQCIHQQVEERMITRGIEPFTCVPAKLIVLAIEEKLDRPVELAEIKMDQSGCHLLLVLFDQRPTLD